MRKVWRQEDRPPHICVRLARQGTQPSLHGIDSLDCYDKAQTIGCLPDRAHRMLQRRLVLLQNGDGQRHETRAAARALQIL